MNSELSLDEAKRLAQARLDEWRTQEHECFISDVTPFSYGWVFSYNLQVDGELADLIGSAPIAVLRTGEVCRMPGFLPMADGTDLLARNWEAAYSPALAVELSEGAQNSFLGFFNRILRGILSSGAEELRIEEAGRIHWRIGSDWDEEDAEPSFIGALFARRLKEMADIDPTDSSDGEAMQSGLIKASMSEVRRQMADGESVLRNGKPIIETRRAVYNMALPASPTTRGEQIVLAIELGEATSTWALSNGT